MEKYDESDVLASVVSRARTRATTLSTHTIQARSVSISYIHHNSCACVHHRNSHVEANMSLGFKLYRFVINVCKYNKEEKTPHYLYIHTMYFILNFIKKNYTQL